MREADYIIVGAGSAGCALAYRLSEDGRNSVLVLEFGGSDAGPFIQMPAAFSIPMNTKTYDWGFRTEPEPHLGDRSLACPRGKVVGGSSSINGMVYVRGHAHDFERWGDAGASGWRYADVLPYFKRMETSHGGERGWRGSDGPLHVTRGRRINPLYKAFKRAGVEAGYGATEDYNGSRQEGFGDMEMTVWRGRRWSAANAYLKPALKRPNVELVTRALAERILFDGNRATGVVARTGAGSETFSARREVIVAASAINSPKLLMLSGIGPASHLKEHGIEVRADRPGVGGNLQDHLEVYVQQQCIKPITLYSKLGLLARAQIGLQWLTTGTGLGATNHFESCAFIRSRAGLEYPDLQMHFLPVAIGEALKTSKKYYGMYVVMVHVMDRIQKTFVRDIHEKHIPKLNEFAEQADKNIEQARSLIKLDGGDRKTLEANISSNELTRETAQLYVSYLKRNASLIASENRRAQKNLATAMNTYDTVKLSSDVADLMSTGRRDFDTLMKLQVPSLREFGNKAIRKEFERLTSELRSET